MPRLNAAPARRMAFRASLTSLLAVMVIIGLTGCAAHWEPVHGRLDASRWSIQAPEGWMHYAAPTYEMLSRYGPYLQYIFIQELPLSAGFTHTRQHLAPDMLPHEMARVIVDDLRADTNISNFSLMANAPVLVGGRPGFKLVYSYRDPQGVAMKTIYYGTVNAAYFFNLRYTAAQRHYFASDLLAFRRVLESLRITAAS